MISSNFIKKLIPVLAALFLFWGCQQPEPQEPDPVQRKSPIAIANTFHKTTDTYIKIVYGQPYQRNRDIFGNVVPFNEVWRTGANEATELTTTQDILIGGEKLEAGTYALFSIPKEDDTWTIILNNVLGQWGAFDYEESEDVLRIEAQTMDTEKSTEMFTIQFSDITGDSTNILLQWDQTQVKIPVEFIQ